jgi:acetyl-CoA acyltransferase
MATAYLVDAIRSARGKRKGTLALTHPVDLLGQVLRHLVERHKLDPLTIDDVITGCVTQVGEQSSNIARGAVLAAGLPIELAGVSLNRFCGSGQQAISFAAQAVASGEQDLVIASGIEHMTRVGMGSDAAQGDGPVSPALAKRYPDLIPQGLSAEMIAEQWKLSRHDVDAFALESQKRAAHAIENGWFKNDIVPVQAVTESGGTVTLERDEHPRPQTTLEALMGLKTAFKGDGVITAGNSSGIVDGAAAVLVASEAAVKKYKLTPRARIVTSQVSGSEPVIMLTGPIPSTRKALAKVGMKADDIDLVEMNEAFAPVVLACSKELGFDLSKVNVNGGAIALGHPLGATGCMLMGTLISELERRKAKRGLQTMCIGYGMGITTIIERI